MSISIKSFFTFTSWLLLHIPIIVNSASDEANINGCSSKAVTSMEKLILTKLEKHNLYGKKYQYKGKEFEYDFVLCGDVKEALPNVSLLKMDKILGTSTPIGYRNETRVAGHIGLGGWTMLTMWSGGEHETNVTTTCKVANVSTVMLVCDVNYPNGEFSFLYEDTEYCQLVFELRIGVICDALTGLSGFSILIIILIVFLALYFIIGILYNRIQLGAKGIDQIPNRNFWFGIGNAFADGCSAVCRCDRCCSEPIEHLDSGSHYSSGGYSPIGDGVSGVPPSQSYERDSQLIRP